MTPIREASMASARAQCAYRTALANGAPAREIDRLSHVAAAATQRLLEVCRLGGSHRRTK